MNQDEWPEQASFEWLISRLLTARAAVMFDALSVARQHAALVPKIENFQCLAEVVVRKEVSSLFLKFNKEEWSHWLIFFVHKLYFTIIGFDKGTRKEHWSCWLEFLRVRPRLQTSENWISILAICQVVQFELFTEKACKVVSQSSSRWIWKDDVGCM